MNKYIKPQATSHRALLEQCRATNDKLADQVRIWRTIAIVMVFGYVVIWANTYIFGGAA
jgi:hypothetical protein